MKFYSEILDKFFDSEQACLFAEKAQKEKELKERQAALAATEAKKKFLAEKKVAKEKLEKAIDEALQLTIDYLEKYENDSIWGSAVAQELKNTMSSTDDKDKSWIFYKKNPNPSISSANAFNSFNSILESFLK